MRETIIRSGSNKWIIPALLLVAILACIAIVLSLYSINSNTPRNKEEKLKNELSVNGHPVEGNVHGLADEFRQGEVRVFSEGDSFVNLIGFSYYGYDDCMLAVRGTPRTHLVYTIEISLPYYDDLTILKDTFFSLREAFLKRYNAKSSSDFIDLHMDVLASANSMSDLYWKMFSLGQESNTPETRITNINNGEIRILTWCNHPDRGTVCIFFNNLNNMELRRQEINKNKEEGKGDLLDELF